MKERYFEAARWDYLLRLITVGIILFAVVFTFFNPNLWVMLAFGAIIVGSYFFMVRGYRVEKGRLVIIRPGWEKSFDLRDLKDVRFDPDAMKWSWRVWGNGGLFGWIGLFRNRRLGMYNAYVSNRYRCVVIELDERPLVISPSDPDSLISSVEKAATKTG